MWCECVHNWALETSTKYPHFVDLCHVLTGLHWLTWHALVLGLAQ